MEQSSTSPPTSLRLITRNLMVWAGVAIALVYVFIAMAAPIIAPHDPVKQDLKARHIPPSWVGAQTETRTVTQRADRPSEEDRPKISLRDARKFYEDVAVGDVVEIPARQSGKVGHIFGTDHLGRDILSRLLYSLRPGVIGGVLAFALGTGAAVILVTVKTRGNTEQGTKLLPPAGILEYPVTTLSLLIIFAGQLPLIVAMVVLGPSFFKVIIFTGVISSILPTAVIYQAVQWKLQCEARPGELPRTGMAAGPNLIRLAINTGVVLAPITFSLAVLMFLLLESFLSFLGIGMQPPVLSVGWMLATGRGYVETSSWIPGFPAGALFITICALVAITRPISDVMRQLQPLVEPPTEGMEYAGFWIRVASIFVDTSAIAFGALVIVVGAAVVGLPENITSQEMAIFLFIFVPVYLGGWKRTMGNRLLGLRVVRSGGEPVSIWRSYLRFLCMVVPPFFWALHFNHKRRAIYDILAGTVVIKQRRT